MSASSQKSFTQASEEMNKAFLVAACEDHKAVIDGSSGSASRKIEKQAHVEELNELDQIHPVIEETVWPQPPPQRVREPLKQRLEKIHAMTQNYFAAMERARQLRREQAELSKAICHAWGENQAPEGFDTQDYQEMDEHQAPPEAVDNNKEMYEHQVPPEAVDNNKEVDEHQAPPEAVDNNKEVDEHHAPPEAVDNNKEVDEHQAPPEAVDNNKEVDEHQAPPEAVDNNKEVDEHQAPPKAVDNNKEMDEHQAPPEAVDNNKEMDEDDEFDYPFLVDNPVVPAAKNTYRRCIPTIMVPLENTKKNTDKNKEKDDLKKEKFDQMFVIGKEHRNETKTVYVRPRDIFNETEEMDKFKSLSKKKKTKVKKRKRKKLRDSEKNSSNETVKKPEESDNQKQKDRLPPIFLKNKKPSSCHQEAPSSHQKAPSSHQKAPSSHQEAPSTHHKAPNSHQKDRKKPFDDNNKLPENKLLARLKKEELFHTSLVDGTPRLVRPKSPVGPRPGHFIRRSKPACDLEQVSEEDEPIERVLYEPEQRAKSRMRRKVEAAWISVRQRIDNHRKGKYIRNQEMMESRRDEHGIEDGSQPLAPGVNLRSCPGETGMNPYWNKPSRCGMDSSRTEPMRAWLSREEKLFCVYGQQQQQKPAERIAKCLYEPRRRPKSGMRRRAEGAWNTVKQSLTVSVRPNSIHPQCIYTKHQDMMESRRDELGIQDGSQPHGLGVHPCCPSGSGMDTPKTKPIRAWLSREERLFCVYGQQQQQKPEEPPKPKKTLGGRLMKFAAIFRRRQKE